MDIEALYTVTFVAGTWGSGVAILETGRIFGGDGMFYYVGDYEVNGNTITGRARVVMHTILPFVPTIFGDDTAQFTVRHRWFVRTTGWAPQCL